ncbi:MAG TPA: hypothetical protein VIP52_14605 [Candidatus Dormibacteraeota bacterium]
MDVVISAGAAAFVGLLALIATSARGPRRGGALSSWARCFIAARSSAENPSDLLSIAVLLLADFGVAFLQVSSQP